jgi:DNA-binding Lrp family transcriptional regulator
MINLKNILEEIDESQFAQGAYTVSDTPEAPAPVGAPVKTNDVHPDRHPITTSSPIAPAPIGSPIKVNQKKLSAQEKRQLLELVREFNHYRNAFKSADELKTVAEKISYIAELTEKYGLNETSEWFEGVTLQRDMKELKKLSTEISKILDKCYKPIKEAEALYEEAGIKLERYFNM